MDEQKTSESMDKNKCMTDVYVQCIECDVCKDNEREHTSELPNASKYCIECQQNLCGQCATQHVRQKLLKQHQVIDVSFQLAEPNQSTEQIPCDYHDSVKVTPDFQGQWQTNEIDVMAEILRERDRLKEYKKEMSHHIDTLKRGQENTNTIANDIAQQILKKHSECLDRLDSDKRLLLEQLNSEKKKILAEYETKLQEATNYFQKMNERNKKIKEILSRNSDDANDEFSKSLLLRIQFYRPVPSLADVSLEKFPWTETDNMLGRLAGLSNISNAPREPTLESYMTFLSNAHSLTTEAMTLHWGLTLLNDTELNSLWAVEILKFTKLELNATDKKLEELQSQHLQLASFLYKVMKSASDSTSEKLDLIDLQRIIVKIWNMVKFQMHYKNSERGLLPKGFQNYGNTCYFNSVLQCLSQTVLLPFELTVSLYGLGNVSTGKGEMYHFGKAFMELTSSYKECQRRKGALKTLYDTFMEAATRFNDHRQHDSHDLLIHFLDKLRVEERNAWKTPSVGQEIQKMLTAVDQVFGGQFITVYTCHKCEEPYAIREPFLDISIPLCKLTLDEKKTEEIKLKPKTIPSEEIDEKQADDLRTPRTSETCGTETQCRPIAEMGEFAENHFICETNPPCSSLNIDNNRKLPFTTEVIKNMLQPLIQEKSAESDTKSFLSRLFTNNLNVSQCLKYFTRDEEIIGEYLCRNCQLPGISDLQMTSATKRTLISSPPAVLVLHLKRFEQRLTGFAKRDEMIDYNELLDLGPSCSSSALRVDAEEENVWYSLYAVVVHSGFFLSRGHYVAYVKQRDSSALLDDQLREKFLQKNLVGYDVVPNDLDLETLQKRNAIKRREQAKPPNPFPGQWFYISDDSVRPCAVKEALEQKAFLLFYERIPGTDEKSTGV